MINEAAFAAVESWRRLPHPNIVSLREAFTTKAFGDNCMLSFWMSTSPLRSARPCTMPADSITNSAGHGVRFPPRFHNVMGRASEF